ncbi:hypothetical protein DID88_004217 [Monilinia fructigena]|uniref:Arrestin-like N-terminal domain-containing protein n=1 Tax=Monilinia fructigena TaxID=38457 RepID=A0A395IS39_9HELO|nr:hypothetical protein DID88_004217 [Monilinia fructigena]
MAAYASGNPMKSQYFGNGYCSLFQDEVTLCGEGRLEAGIYRFNYELEFPNQGCSHKRRIRERNNIVPNLFNDYAANNNSRDFDVREEGRAGGESRYRPLGTPRPEQYRLNQYRNDQRGRGLLSQKIDESASQVGVSDNQIQPRSPAQSDVQSTFRYKGKEAERLKHEEYYPKSKTGLGGLSLSSAGSTSVFRKDLSQTFAPLIVDPTTLTAQVTASVRVPEDCFPTICGVPGQMVNFKYQVEVISTSWPIRFELDRISTSGPSAPSLSDLTPYPSNVTDDKQELERQRLLAEASAPSEFPEVEEEGESSQQGAASAPDDH